MCYPLAYASNEYNMNVIHIGYEKQARIAPIFNVIKCTLRELPQLISLFRIGSDMTHCSGLTLCNTLYSN